MMSDREYIILHAYLGTTSIEDNHRILGRRRNNKIKQAIVRSNHNPKPSNICQVTDMKFRTHRSIHSLPYLYRATNHQVLLGNIRNLIMKCPYYATCMAILVSQINPVTVTQELIQKPSIKISAKYLDIKISRYQDIKISIYQCIKVSRYQYIKVSSIKILANFNC